MCVLSEGRGKSLPEIDVLFLTTSVYFVGTASSGPFFFCLFLFVVYSRLFAMVIKDKKMYIHKCVNGSDTCDGWVQRLGILFYFRSICALEVRDV